ncbi:hypothetical protein CAEBREN_05874 [Caenorhabditis brenneri]|uniref:BTB domain-containing protein n=1 Tax=Caenorhabditis brenneri TaxID=135651 RepID=G0MQ56_CAEBE|nr:hypothetical protein CAEBREN_05874 [Caenorhabditis brenneri]
MTGPTPKRQRATLRFDVEDEALNDVCVIVQDVKFYVSKKHLSMHSDHFRDMFSGRLLGKNQKEIVLQDVKDPMDFQRFLELINGIPCLTDDNIDGVSSLAEMLRADIVQDRCLDFLNEKSMMPDWEKLEIAMKYSFMKEYKADIISNIRTPEELQDVIPEDIDQLDKETSNMILKKSLALHRAPPVPAYNNPPANPRLNFSGGLFEPLPFAPTVQPQFRNELFIDVNPPPRNVPAPSPQPQIQVQDPVIFQVNDERILEQIRLLRFAGLLN